MMSARSRRDAGSPPERCTCSTPGPAASRNTRAQVAVSSSLSRLSISSGFEQYGQPSGQRWVSSARRPSGLWSGFGGWPLPPACPLGRLSVVMASQFQQLLVCEPPQERGDIGLDALARRREGGREIIQDGREARLAGAALDDLGGDLIGLEHALRRQQHPAALGLVMDEPHAARQAGTGVRQDRWRRGGRIHLVVSFFLLPPPLAEEGWGGASQRVHASLILPRKRGGGIRSYSSGTNAPGEMCLGIT